ncbi:Spo0B domain-containing protein [Pelotomaculum isophthalicicum JI]|uniref:Spo0B domain-containing protein n=1 Tax=Pelotomaculum isophthalicicum JI TaxID=947010 RepID=A0A9X4H1R2_9FIRM|nr:Spo0B domain-containing protein [Pelotomaculum isophthalicicum]MDF9407801.1 Spo0B domain-containing protein [Pelotomaculum isophthalicicum JI]
MKLSNIITNKNYIYGLFFILIQATFFITIILSYENLTEHFLLTLIIVLSLLYPLITFIMIYLYLKYDSQKEIIEKIEDFNISLRKQRHDFFAHLQVIYGLIDCDEIEEAINYLKSIEASVKNKSLVYKSNKPQIGIVLSAFAMKAEAKEVRFELYGLDDFSKFPLSSTHTVTVLSNLLNNALDNCEKNGCVYVETETDKNYFYLKVSNDGKPIEIIHGDNPDDWQKELFQGKSSKGKDRGLGLLIIKEILSQYDDCNLLVLDREKPTFMLKLKIVGGGERT